MLHCLELPIRLRALNHGWQLVHGTKVFLSGRLGSSNVTAGEVVGPAASQS